MSTALVDQLVRESDLQADPAARTDQLVRESAVQSSPNARASQLIREAAARTNPNARVSQVLRESWVPIKILIDQLVRESDIQGVSRSLVSQLARESWIDINPPAPCEVAFFELKYALACRLDDTQKIFWSDTELGLYIAEALRTWNALTATWNADYSFTITGPATQVWYALNTLSGYPRKPVMVDSDIYTMMQYHLLEPATGGGAWTGSSQFALTDLVGALQRRRDEVIQLAGTNLATRSIPVSAGERRTAFGDNILEIRRVRFVPNAGSPTTLWRDDGLGFQDFAPNYLQGNPSPGQQAVTGPQQYNLTSNPPLNLDVDYPPSAGGVYDIVALVSGACLAPPAPSLLSIPDDLSWVAKWGAMSDLLGSEGERYDALRAAYCLQRYKDGLTLAAQAPWLLLGKINGIPYDTVAMTEMDQFAPEWDSNPNAQPCLVQAGLDFLAVSPVPQVNTTVALTVIGNAPIPVADGDIVQASRDVLDVILDYAQHLASLKQGGAEFMGSMPLVKNFAMAAMATNSRLEALGLFRDILLEEGRLQESAQERFSETQ